MKTILKYWIPVILWMGFTFLMSTGMLSGDNTSHIIKPILKFLMPSLSPYQLQLLHSIIRKLAHLVEYFILSLLLFRALRGNSTDQHPWRWVISSILILIVFATSDEVHQSFVGTRTASIVDVAIDTVGGILAQCISIFLHYRQRKKSK